MFAAVPVMGDTMPDTCCRALMTWSWPEVVVMTALGCKRLPITMPSPTSSSLGVINFRYI